MLFNSLIFLVFLAIVWGAYFALKDYRHQNVLLLLASFVFYGAAGLELTGLLFGYVVTTYFCGLAIDKLHYKSNRKFVLFLGIFANLFVLGIFKYADFFLENLSALLSALGFRAHESTLGIILPIGISFYAFQCIAYLIDVYRRDLPATRDFIAFALYISFFPQLVAGPIERAAHMLPQFERQRTVSRDCLLIGFAWIATGYVFKVVIADTVAPLVDFYFTYPWLLERSGVEDLMAVFAFGLQIFGDFAGYSLIARGIARVMGIRLMRNFRNPYLATDPQDFWRRWHISLSTWLRDYLYISLGGSRHGARKTYRNLIATMGLGGLWHGASWNFVLWGLFHGALLSLGRAFGISNDTISSPAELWTRRLITFLLVTFGWFLFRVDSIPQFMAMTANIFWNFHWTSHAAAYLSVLLVLYGLVFAHHLIEEKFGDEEWIRRLAWPVRLSFAVAALATVVATGFSSIQFIYFRF